MSDFFDIAVIGAGPAGMSAAVYARRAGLSVVVFEGEMCGGQMILTPEVENYPGIAKISGAELSYAMQEQMTALGAVLVEAPVTAVKKENAKVVCHVGRLARQKNHRRILSLLNQLTRQDESIYGLLIGTGPLDAQLRSAAQSSHIQFLGSRTDVADLLCAADVFLFPSLHEGLGIAAVEAQACGLPCIASTNVPDSADIGAGLFTRLPLSAPDQAWLGQIERSFQQDMATRAARSRLALSSAYQIETVAAAAQRFDLSLE